MTLMKIKNKIFKCKSCDYEVILTGKEKDVITAANTLFTYHKVYSKECKSSIDELKNNLTLKDINKENKYNLESLKIIDNRFNETEAIVNNIIKNTIKYNKTYIENIESPFNNYINDIKYQYIGIILIRDISISSNDIIKMIISILANNENCIKNYNFLIINSNDFDSVKKKGDAELKIQAIFNTIKNLYDDKSKKTLLVINDIDTILSDENTRLDTERINSFTTEFEKIYNDKTMFIIGLVNNIKKVPFIENRFEVAKFK